MARKKKTIIEEDLNEQERTDREGLDPDEIADIEDAQMLREATAHWGPPTDVQVRVTKLLGGDQGTSYCFTTDAESFSEDYLAENFGPGRYSLKLLVNRAYKGTRYLSIAPRLKPANGAMLTPESMQISMLQQQLQWNQTLLQQLLKAGNPQHTPMNELAEAVRTVHSLNGGGNGTQPDMMERVISAFMRGLDLGKDTGGGGDWKSDLVRVVREAVPAIAPAIASGALMNKNGQQPGATPINESEAVLLQQGIAKLKKMVLMNVDPDLVVDWIQSNAEEYKHILSRIVRVDFAQFCSIDPEIGTEPYVTWFKQVYDGLRSAFQTTFGMVPDSGGPSGDTPDTTSDAKTGA